jgi:hypothetical protein
MTNKDLFGVLGQPEEGNVYVPETEPPPAAMAEGDCVVQQGGRASASRSAIALPGRGPG